MIWVWSLVHACVTIVTASHKPCCCSWFVWHDINQHIVLLAQAHPISQAVMCLMMTNWVPWKCSLLNNVQWLTLIGGYYLWYKSIQKLPWFAEVILQFTEIKCQMAVVSELLSSLVLFSPFVHIALVFVLTSWEIDMAHRRAKIGVESCMSLGAGDRKSAQAQL